MSLPPTYQTSIFNSAFFSNSTDPLTLDVADKRYLQLGGGTITGSLYVSNTIDASAITSASYQLNGVNTNTSALTGITDGSALASKALILDASTNIKDINQITCGTVISNGITTSNATVNGDLNITGNFKLSGTTLDFTNLGLLSGITPGLAQASRILSTDSSNVLKGLSELRFNNNLTSSQRSVFRT